jgi:hypothetical protein
MLAPANPGAFLGALALQIRVWPECAIRLWVRPSRSICPAQSSRRHQCAESFPSLPVSLRVPCCSWRRRRQRRHLRSRPSACNRALLWMTACNSPAVAAVGSAAVAASPSVVAVGAAGPSLTAVAGPGAAGRSLTAVGASGAVGPSRTAARGPGAAGPTLTAAGGGAAGTARAFGAGGRPTTATATAPAAGGSGAAGKLC